MISNNRLLYEISNLVNQVTFQLEDLSDICGKMNSPLKQKNYDEVYVLEEVGNLLSILSELEEKIPEIRLSILKSQSASSIKYFKMVKEGLLKQQVRLVHTINYEIDNWDEISDQFNILSGYWDERFLDYIDEKQYVELIGLDNFVIDNQYHFFAVDDADQNEKIAMQTMLKNAKRAEKVFFSLNQHPENGNLILVKDLIKSELLNAGRARCAIDFTSLNGRQLISCYGQAIADNIENVHTENLSNNDFFIQSHFPSYSQIKIKKGYVQRNNLNSGVTIFGNFKPARGHVGNHFIPGVGQYGNAHNRDILSVINTITQENPENECRLAKLFLRYKCGKADAFSYESLRESGIDTRVNQKVIKRLYKLAYLFCFVEVIRRMNPGYKDNYKIKKLPFNTAIVCVLILIYQGKLKMADVFAKDSLYGVVTGKEITDKSNIDKTIKKFDFLFKLFLDSQEKIHAEEDLSKLFCTGVFDITLFHYIPTQALFLALFAQIDEGRDWVSIPINNQNNYDHFIKTDVSSTSRSFKF